MTFDDLNTDLVDTFGVAVTHHCAEGLFTASVIVSDPTAAMEAPAGALKVAFGNQSSFTVLPKDDGEDRIEIEDGTTYRIFDVKVDEGGGVRMALTQ